MKGAADDPFPPWANGCHGTKRPGERGETAGGTGGNGRGTGETVGWCPAASRKDPKGMAIEKGD